MYSTQKQVEFAATLGIDVSTKTSKEASLMIENALRKNAVLKVEELARSGFVPGRKVLRWDDKIAEIVEVSINKSDGKTISVLCRLEDGKKTRSSHLGLTLIEEE